MNKELKQQRLLKISAKLRELEPSESPEPARNAFSMNNPLEMVSIRGESSLGLYRSKIGLLKSRKMEGEQPKTQNKVAKSGLSNLGQNICYNRLISNVRGP